jgi:hypothetical protein
MKFDRVMGSTAHLLVEELRASLSELAKNCPVDECNPEDCPLFPLREMQRGERLRWFNALNEDDLRYLAAYHHVCMNLKLTAQKRSAPKVVRES